MSLKCNEEGKSLSTETFAKVSLTNLRRQAVPDLSSDLGMNIFKKVSAQFDPTVGFFTLKTSGSAAVQEPTGGPGEEGLHSLPSRREEAAAAHGRPLPAARRPPGRLAHTQHLLLRKLLGPGR